MGNLAPDPTNLSIFQGESKTVDLVDPDSNPGPVASMRFVVETKAAAPTELFTIDADGQFSVASSTVTVTILDTDADEAAGEHQFRLWQDASPKRVLAHGDFTIIDTTEA